MLGILYEFFILNRSVSVSVLLKFKRSSYLLIYFSGAVFKLCASVPIRIALGNAENDTNRFLAKKPLEPGCTAAHRMNCGFDGLALE